MFTPDFLQDYLIYNEGNEVPKNFHIWSALALVSAVASHKVFISQGYFIHNATLYICLVRDQGDRKSTAKDIARDILLETFPDIPVAASVTTREAITKYLGSEESIRSYTDANGNIVEYHPYVLFINELKKFLSVNPGGMIDFLTDIYDRKYFRVETKNKGIDIIINPCLTILACETPSWIVRKLKEDIITGGFSRRVIMVYERSRPDPIPRPIVSTRSIEVLVRVKEHLKKIYPIVGEFSWDAEGGKMFDEWYIQNSTTLPDDPVMRGFRRTLDVQLLKVCMHPVVKTEGADLAHAFEFLSLLRIRHQHERIVLDLEPDNFIHLGRLSSLNQHTLRQICRLLTKIIVELQRKYGETTPI